MFGPQPFQPPPDGRRPRDVRILSLRVEPWPEDPRRVRAHLELTPFLERPDIAVSIANLNGEELSSIQIIEGIDDRMAFTLHLRGDLAGGKLTLSASLSYPEIGEVDQKQIQFEIVV